VYVAESKSNTKVRLFPFEFSTDQSYAIEAGNQYFRFFTNNDVIYKPYGTEDLSAFSSNIIAHWLCNDNAATTNVLDDDGNTHDGTLIGANTEDVTTTDEEGTANGAFDLADTYWIRVNDHDDFSFGDGTNDNPFTLLVWLNYSSSGTWQYIINKYDEVAPENREWLLAIKTADSDKIYFQIYDESADKVAKFISSDSVTEGWHFIVATYQGNGGSNAADGLDVYLDWIKQKGVRTTESGYIAMENGSSRVDLGANDAGSHIIEDKIHNIAILNRALTYSEIASLTGNNSTIPYEITTPFLTTDLYDNKYKQSADVLYFTHPDYEPRKLSRYGDAVWQIETTGIKNGPFLDENTDITKTITPSAITGSITLTATGHSPFVDGTTAGHEPSGSISTSKSQTGALFKLVQSLETAAYEEILSDNYTNNQTEDVSWMDCGSIAKGVTWYLTTLGTWTGTLEVQRNYTIGAAHGAAGWEQVFTFQSNDDRNASTSAEETVDEADYRVILTASGDAAEPCQVYFRISDIDHVGIVEITAVTDSQTATATVIKTLADTTATHRWSEGAWSNYRGWPRAVTFFEDRLVFGGNTNQPDTVWLSATGDYENMEAGTDDDEAMLFTLSSRQVNVIEWMVGKDNLIIGTSGAEWTLRGGTDEPLTPSNVKAEQQSSHGSANLQATLASESILFFQRGAEKMRELAYNWESDSYVAPEMTLLVPEVTGDGITSVDYQKIPNSILWCVRDDGEMAVFSYERAEQVTSWSRFITDGLFESVIVINGDPEDQVWVSVNRTIGGSTKRYIEYFSARDFGTDVDDAYFVDSGITYDDVATTTITGLTHLEAETVAVLGDGAIQTSQTVSSGQITITQASTVQAGLPFTVQMKTMPLSFLGAGTSIIGRIKRVSGLTAEYYNSGDFEYGKDSSNKFTISVTGMDSDITPRKTFPAGYGKKGQVFIYQQSPEPFTLVSLGLDFEVF
ncbi:MAG: LamG-like jellyroll fold domain-containing protein, partial [Planctomycetota bacterium]